MPDSAERVICQRDMLKTLARLPVPAFAFDLSTLLFVAANPQFEQLLGYSMSELSSLTAESIRPSGDVETFRLTLGQEVPRGLVEARLVSKSGTLLMVKNHYWKSQCLRDDGAQTSARVVVVEFWQELSAEVH